MCMWHSVQTYDLLTTAGSDSAITDPYLPSCLNFNRVNKINNRCSSYSDVFVLELFIEY